MYTVIRDGQSSQLRYSGPRTLSDILGAGDCLSIELGAVEAMDEDGESISLSDQLVHGQFIELRRVKTVVEEICLDLKRGVMSDVYPHVAFVADPPLPAAVQRKIEAAATEGKFHSYFWTAWPTTWPGNYCFVNSVHNIRWDGQDIKYLTQEEVRARTQQKLQRW
jgi:hypothetical protein